MVYKAFLVAPDGLHKLYNRSSYVFQWLNLIKSMMREAEWFRNKELPKTEEYMENAYISMALGPIVLPALYFVGPKLSAEIVKSPEIQNLFKIMSTCGRLLNDIRTFKVDAS